SITGVIGPNGAGKSTLLKTIFGFLHPHRGRIALDGREIHTLAPYEIKRLGISYVPQGANIFPQLTVEENLQLGAWLIRPDRARVRRVSAPQGKAAPARDHAVGRGSEDAVPRQGAGDRALAASRGRAVGGPGATHRRAGIRPAPGRAGPGRDHPARGPEHQ